MNTASLSAAAAVTMALITTSAPGAELNVGGAWADMHSSLALAQNNGSSSAANTALATAGSAGFSPSSFALGAQLGFDYQFAPQF